MAQEGFLYEENASNFLKKMGLVKETFRPVGAAHDRPDLEITYKGQTEGVELKITSASAGSLVLKYNEKARNGSRWQFNDTTKDAEKAFIASVAEDAGALKLINSKWTEVPLKRETTDQLIKSKINKMEPRKRYAIDAANFPELNKEISADYISKYYNHKKTYYVNVGTNGFYLLGNYDPFGLNKNLRGYNLPLIPSFGSKAKAKWRARVQPKGGGSYQFTFELSFSIRNSDSSPYNIAPVSGSSVSIVTQKANVSCFI